MRKFSYFSAEDDPRRFKPNPEALVEDSKEGKYSTKLLIDSCYKDEDGDDSNKIYKAPRLVEMHYDEKTQDAKKKKEERIKKRAAKSALMKDIMAEYSYEFSTTTNSFVVRNQKMHLQTVVLEKWDLMRKI